MIQMDNRRFDNESFYDVLSANIFLANAWTAGPWDPRLQHGGPPAALLGRALEMRRTSPDARVASIVLISTDLSLWR